MNENHLAPAPPAARRRLDLQPASLAARAADRPWPALGLILLFALGLAAVKLWLDPPSFEFNWENRWWQIAVNVARSQGYVACKPDYFPFCGPANQATAMREPLPVLLMALVAAATNESLLAAALLGVGANLLIIAAVFWLARELAGPPAGIVAALLWAIYLPPIRLFYSHVSGDLFATLGVTCGLAFLLRARRSGKPVHWLGAGLCLGLAMLARSAVLAVALVLTLGLLVWPRAEAKGGSARYASRLSPALLFALAWAVTISPWFVRNYVVFDRPVLGSTLSGYYLYRQNHMLASDDYLRFVSGGEFAPVLKAMVARHPGLRGTENEAEMDHVYRAEALRIIASEPARYALLSLFRFPMLWFNWGVNAVYRIPDTAGDYVMMLQQALLLAGGLAGLRGNWRQAWPLAASVAAFSLLYMAVMSHLPYIIPIMPLLAALSAAAIVRYGGRWLGARDRTSRHEKQPVNEAIEYVSSR